MSTLPTVQNMQLPAHLAKLQTNTALMGLNQAAAGGISSGGWPRISIKGGYFRLQSPQGEEVVVNTRDLDVIVVDANPHGLSKIYYAGVYDPSTEEKAPDCYSDNGVGPSQRAAKPQCGTCAVCPHNVWGSKINPSGSQTKACSDVKKVAVLIASNPEGPVFELRIPPASLKNFAAYINGLDSRGIPAAGIVTKLKFDTASDFPKLLFEAAGWATEEQVQVVMDVIGTEEVDVCTGKNDKAIDPARVAAAPPPVSAIANTAGGPITTAPMPPRVQPTPLQQFAPAAIPAASPASVPEMPKATRTRKPRGSAAAPVSAADPAPLPPFIANMAPAANAVNTAAPLNPPVTDAALDALLASAMQK